MSNNSPRKRFVQGVDLLSEQGEKTALKRARKVTSKKRGFSLYVRNLIVEDIERSMK